MRSMFWGCKILITLDLSSFYTTNVINMDAIFALCYNLENLIIDNFDTSNVTLFRDMFAYLSKIKEFNVSNFNTSNAINMIGMFSNCLSLVKLNLSNFNTTNVTDMRYMFSKYANLQTTINILNANTTYTGIFTNALTDANANITIGYTTETKAIVEAMKETADNNKSKITLKQI